MSLLCRFLPATYQEFCPVLIEGDFEKETSTNAWKKKSYRLSLAAWMVAWDKYAMAANGLGQLSYKMSRLHHANVCDIAFASCDKECTELLGVLYDELVREQWASMSAKVRTYRAETQVCLSVAVCPSFDCMSHLLGPGANS